MFRKQVFARVSVSEPCSGTRNGRCTTSPGSQRKVDDQRGVQRTSVLYGPTTEVRRKYDGTYDGSTPVPTTDMRTEIVRKSYISTEIVRKSYGSRTQITETQLKTGSWQPVGKSRAGWRGEELAYRKGAEAAASGGAMSVPVPVPDRLS